MWYAIRQTRLEADLADEMDFHREMTLTELKARGLASPGRRSPPGALSEAMPWPGTSHATSGEGKNERRHNMRLALLKQDFVVLRTKS